MVKNTPAQYAVLSVKILFNSEIILRRQITEKTSSKSCWNSTIHQTTSEPRDKCSQITPSPDCTALPSLIYTEQENVEHAPQVTIHNSGIGSEKDAPFSNDIQVLIIINNTDTDENAH